MTTQTKTTWRKVKLGEVGKIITGKTPSTKEPKNFGGPFPFITIPDLKDQRFIVKTERTISETGAQKMKNLKLPANAVVMSCLATVGETGIIMKESFTNQQINSVICDPRQVDYKFLYYAFRRLKRRLQKYDGSVYTNISKTKFADLEIEIPEDVSIQKRIAEILSAFDEKIELNNKISRTLEEMAQAIFKEWFIENSKFKNQNAKLWKEKRLGEVMQFEYGKALKAEERKTGNIPVVGSSGIVGLHDKKLVAGPGIVIGRKGTVGSVIWIDTDFYPIDTTFYVVSPSSLYFCYFILKRQKFITGDSAVPGLNRNTALNNEIVVPPKELIDKFEEQVKPLFQKMHSVKMENQKLAALRDLLLSKLMSGEIKV